MKKLINCFILMGFLSGCGSLGHKFENNITPKQDEVLIYYYRPSHFVGGAVYYDVKENGEIITTLYNGGYYPHITTAGEKTVTAETEASESIYFSAEKGKTYYVRGGVDMGAFIGRPSLNLIQAEQARQEIQDCRIIEQSE